MSVIMELITDVTLGYSNPRLVEEHANGKVDVIIDVIILVSRYLTSMNAN